MKRQVIKTYKLFQIDAFTDAPFRGNPAGVVLDADDLSDMQMLAITRELGNSETAFVMAPSKAGADVRVRFFTPRSEVPICGHATIAAHFVRALELGLANGSHVLQETLAGLLPVDISREGERIFVTMTQGEPRVGKELGVDARTEIAAALGVEVSAFASDLPLCVASTGHAKIFVPLLANSRGVLNALKPDFSALAKLSEKFGESGFFVFTLFEGERFLSRGRMFSPSIGVNEDPVTGNANGALGAYLVACGRTCKNGEDFVFEAAQGEAIDREGSMSVRVKRSGKKPLMVQITGTAVVAFRGTIQI